jgi:glycosyltransferase 2 family protein
MNTRSSKRSHLIKNLCSIVITLAFMIALLISLYKNYDSLREQPLNFSLGQFVMSLFPLMADYFFIPFMWCSILASLGVTLSYRKAFRIQYLSHLGRYIPGKIWSYLAQSYLASQEHISLTETFCSNVILMFLMNLSGFLIFALSFLAWNIFTFFTRCLLVALIFLIFYYLFRIHFLEKSINFVLIRFTNMQINLQCTYLHYGALSMAISASWLVFTIGLHAMINSFYDVSINESFIITGIFSISWLVGYYAFLSPGGLGIQEGVQVYLLTFFFPLPISIVIAFASRLWMTLGDIMIFLLAIALTMHENRLQRSTHGA